MAQLNKYDRANLMENQETDFMSKEANLRNILKVFVVGIFSFAISLSVHPAKVFANNLSVSNVRLIDQDTSADTIVAEFDISWSNAWKDPVNNDAAWVFFKYSTDSGSTWYHATLKASGTNPTGFSTGSKSSGSFAALDIIVPADKKGCFIQPRSQGAGSLSFTDLQAVWDYGHDGLSDSTVSASTTRIKVFAIEMVYIPEEGFYAGDGTAGTNGEFQYGGSATGEPGAINSEDGIAFMNNSANGWYYKSAGNSGENSSGASFWVSEAFPKGYQAFYLMKYEITQGQYADFLNNLTSTQASNRYPNQNGNYRHTISGSYASYSATRADRACNYLNWMDVAAYADWAALRPFSELEFEKVCRGPLYPVSGEYAWGTTSATAAAAISGTENGTETITTANANLNYNNTTFTGGDGGQGPLRAGIFATSSTVTRQSTGSGYYGNTELSGNLWERCVTVGNATGRGFAGTHGDGVLTTTTSYEGNATNLDWPGISSTPSRGVTSATGSGFRGGTCSVTVANYQRISDRTFAALDQSTRDKERGGRLARTAE